MVIAPGLMARAGLLAAALATLCASTSPAWAQPALRGGDFALENRAWNGLSDFVALAEGQGYELQPMSSIDFGALGPDDRLIVIFPTEELDAQQLARFVIDGGRLVLADDHGASREFLERLGIRRVPTGEARHARYFLGRPGLPIFTPGGKHPLLEDVGEVVANHPAALQTEGGAILPYDDGASGLVYDMRLGRGKVVVIGDSSVLINHMLEVRDNKRFLRNTLDYLCRGLTTCRPRLVVGDFVMEGTYAPKNAHEEDLKDAFEDTLGVVNQFIEELTSYVPARNAVYFASLLLMVGLIVFMITVFSWRRAAIVAPEVGPPAHVRPLSEFEWNLLRYEHGGFQANYALPMAILKAEFERRVFRALAPGEPVPPQDDPRRAVFLRQVAQRFVERHQSHLSGRARARSFKQALALLRLFSRIPPRHRLFLDSETYFGERELMRVHGRATQMLEHIGAGQDHEQHPRRREPPDRGDRP